MSDSTNAQASDEDVLLTVLASFAAKDEEFGMAVTLTTAGGVVSGMLVNRSAWFDRMTADYPILQPFSEGFKNALNDQDSDRAEDDMNFGFLHLVDARVFVGAESIPSEGFCWRGRISQVVGFSFGSLTRSETS